MKKHTRRKGQHVSRDTWLALKTDYMGGKGSLRALAAQYGVSATTVMHRSAREGWAAMRTASGSKVDAAVTATLQQRAERFVHKVADQTDKLVDRVSEHEAALQPDNPTALRTLSAAFKDIVAVGRDTYGLSRDDNTPHVLVNLEFLQQPPPMPIVTARQIPTQTIETTQ